MIILRTHIVQVAELGTHIQDLHHPLVEDTQVAVQVLLEKLDCVARTDVRERAELVMERFFVIFMLPNMLVNKDILLVLHQGAIATKAKKEATVLSIHVG